MVASRIIQKKMSPMLLQADANNSSYSRAEPYPPMADASDYEVQVHLNFETQEMRLLKVIGATEEAADILLFTREKCQPECADENCRACRTRKLYQDSARDPQGSVPFSPHQEYLYCLRFDRHPITALLSLTPREHDVEVKEKGVLAYWFMKWLERSKFLSSDGAVAGIQQQQSLMLPAGGASSQPSANYQNETALRTQPPESQPSTPPQPQPQPQHVPAINVAAPAAASLAMNDQLQRRGSGHPSEPAQEQQRRGSGHPSEPAQEQQRRGSGHPSEPTQEQQRRGSGHPSESRKEQRKASGPFSSKPDGKDSDDEDEASPPECSVMHRGSHPGPGGTELDECPHKLTSAYLPNMQVIYQVKKDQMSIVLPKPEQLTRPIDILLLSADKDGNAKRQSIPLVPGAVQSSNSLVALRNTAYTLQVQLSGMGRPVDLLDFVTEHKILRVQESKDAPKMLNFLMERLIEQRGTFVLHITFDEKIVEVGTKPIGEFYLDVDVDSHKMMIGTIQSHVAKHYRVEKISKQAGSNVLLAEKQLIFEGGVDPATLAIKESIPIERMSDYVITVVDPVTKQSLPTSVLAFHKHALFVKEIKNSDVRLHVTVQRQPSVMLQSSNANNLRALASAPAFAIRRPDTSAAFHCPFRSGWTNFRIHHSTAAGWFENPAKSSPASVSHATSTADTASKTAESCLNLDVDLPRLKARLVSGGSHVLDGALFIVYEESFDGKMRSTPCKMSQAFKIRNWCKYSVKCVEETSLTALLTFCVTDKEVTDIRPCSSKVRIGKRFVHDLA